MDLSGLDLHGGLAGGLEGQGTEVVEVPRRGTRASGQKRTLSTKELTAAAVKAESAHFLTEAADAAEAGHAAAVAVVMPTDREDKQTGKADKPAAKLKDKLACSERRRSEAGRRLAERPSQDEDLEGQIDVPQQNDAYFNDASLKSTVIQSRETPHRGQHKPTSYFDKLLSAEQLAELVEQGLPGASSLDEQEGRASTFVRHYDVSQ